MKKSILLLAVAATTIFASCSSDDDGGNNGNNDNGENQNTFVVDPTNFQGDINDGTITLDANEVYDLTGALVVNEGAKLIIPAGTRIEASGGTASYIAVAQGAQIDVLGTASNPVVMTSASNTPLPGDWGGLVICGNAPTNKGGSNGETATSEVADLTYGGSNVNDNSGIIEYLRVEYTGATFNGSKEFNGVSLFAVGAGTVFQYVQSYNGGDDGIEFFGGTVDGKYLVSTASGDDSIDFADGWSGTGEYWYINEVTKAGIEGSNNGDNGNATPGTNVTLKNISIVKGSATGSEGALYIKEGGGLWNAENIHISGFDLGIKIKSDDTAANANVDSGNITFNKIQFSPSVTTKTQYEGTNTDYLNEQDNAGAGKSAEVPLWTAGWTTGL
jgi:hypothetical protein